MLTLEPNGYGIKQYMVGGGDNNHGEGIMYAVMLKEWIRDEVKREVEKGILVLSTNIININTKYEY